MKEINIIGYYAFKTLIQFIIATFIIFSIDKLIIQLLLVIVFVIILKFDNYNKMLKLFSLNRVPMSSYKIKKLTFGKYFSLSNLLYNYFFVYMLMIDKLELVLILVIFEIIFKIFVGNNIEEYFTQASIEEVGNYENEI